MKKYFLLLPLVVFIFACGNGKDENKNDGKDSSEVKTENPMNEIEMTKEMAEKQKQNPQPNPYKDAKIDVVVYNNDTVKQDAKYTGYGYKILIYGAPQVNQPHKPGMPGLEGFKTAAYAKKVGEFVAYKIRNNIMPPSITMQEMDSLGVLK